MREHETWKLRSIAWQGHAAEMKRKRRVLWLRVAQVVGGVGIAVGAWWVLR